MKTHDWLAKATPPPADTRRPVMTMGYSTCLGDEMVTWATDAYRMHMVWGGTVGEVTTFEKSNDDEFTITAGLKWANGVNFSTLIHPIQADFLVRTDQLLAALKPLSACRERTRKGGWRDTVQVSYTVGDTGLAFFAENQGVCDCASACPASVTGRQIMRVKNWVSRPYLLDALRGFGKRERIHLMVTTGDQFLVGVPGERLAFIMGMSVGKGR